MRYNHELVDDHRKIKTTATNDQLYPLITTGNINACEEMIINNMPLVIYIVESYLARLPEFYNLRDDLVGEGLLGLTKAVNAMANNDLIPSNINPVAFISVTIRNYIRNYLSDEIHDESIEPDLYPDKIDECPDELIDEIMSCCDPTESEVIDLWICGNTIRDISNKLNITRMTVQRIIEAVKDKLIIKINK